MENNGIINFASFFEESNSPRKDVFKKEDFGDFFLPEDIFESEEKEEKKEKEEKIDLDPSFDPPVDPKSFIIEEPDFEYDEEESLTPIKEEVESTDYYAVYKDKSENFSCDVMVEGVSISDTEVRLILESEEWTIMFKGDVDKRGKCNIPMKKLNILNEGDSGKIRLEVIADNTVFTPWEEDFKVKVSKKVAVSIHESKSVQKKPVQKTTGVKVNVKR